MPGSRRPGSDGHRPPNAGRRPNAPPGAHQRADRARFSAADDEIVNTQSVGRNLGEWVVLLGGAFAIAMFIRVFVLQAFLIPSESMVPTLMVGDRVLVNKLADSPASVERGDVVVFKRPPELQNSSINDVIKRVIALPGDTVKGQGGVLYVNNRVLPEEYLPPGTETIELPEQTVPEGTLWVMGDNRTDSSDSRVFGPIDEDLVVGKAIAIFWPLEDLGTL